MTMTDINEDEKRLQVFVKEYEDYYGQSNVTMNLHNLIHLCDTVKHHGPLWCQSMFSMEANNGHLANLAKSTCGVVENIAKKYTMKIDTSRNRKDKEIVAFLGRKQQHQLSGIQKEVLINHNILHTSFIWLRCTINNVIFTSTLYKETKSSDFFVEFKDGSLGSITFYFEDRGSKYVFFEYFDVLAYIGHVVEIQPTNTYSIKKIEEVANKMLHMKLKMNTFVSKIANYYESS